MCIMYMCLSQKLTGTLYIARVGVFPTSCAFLFNNNLLVESQEEVILGEPIKQTNIKRFDYTKLNFFVTLVICLHNIHV